MPSVAPEAEKQAASTFKWIVDANQFTTKTDVATRNLHVGSKRIGEESNLLNLGKFLTGRTPDEVEAARLKSTSIDPSQYHVRSTALRPVSGRTTTVDSFYGFAGRGNNVAEDRVFQRDAAGSQLTEKSYDRICCAVQPVAVSTTRAGTKLQDWNFIEEKTAPQRGGLDSRNYVKDQLTPPYPKQTLPNDYDLYR